MMTRKKSPSKQPEVQAPPLAPPAAVEVQETVPPRGFPIVGIGASAG